MALKFNQQKITQCVYIMATYTNRDVKWKLANTILLTIWVWFCSRFLPNTLLHCSKHTHMLYCLPCTFSLTFDPFHELHLEVLGCGFTACACYIWWLCGGVMRGCRASFLSLILWHVSLHSLRRLCFSLSLRLLIIFFLPDSKSSLYFSRSFYKYLSLLSGSTSCRAR